MTLLRMLAVASIAMAVAGCEQTAAPPPAASTPTADSANASAPDVVESGSPLDSALASSRPVAVPVEGANEAVFLAEGESVTYQVEAPAEGVLNGLGVQIGNFGGSSDGGIGIRVCQAESCSEGTASLAGSVDNASLAVGFSTPLQVTQGPLEVQVSRASGYNPFAVWAYPSESRMTLQDGSEAGKVLNTVLFYDIR